MTTNTKIAYWLHDRAAEMIDGDDDAFPDALRALVKRLLLEEKAAAAEPAERKPVAGWVNDADNHRILPLPSGSASAWDGGTSYVSLACPRPSIAPEGTLESAQRETASLRHAALFAAGIHGGPGAWRWVNDPQGTILDDEAAWERLLGEMREVTRQREERSAKRAAEEEKRAAYRLKVIREGYCMADRDGDCGWEDCPQTADGEPAKSGRHCPRDDDAHRGDK